MPKEHCKQVPKKVEKQVPRTKCQKVPDKRCQDFPINVPRKECKEFPKTVCTQASGTTQLFLLLCFLKFKFLAHFSKIAKLAPAH